MNKFKAVSLVNSGGLEHHLETARGYLNKDKGTAVAGGVSVKNHRVIVIPYKTGGNEGPRVGNNQDKGGRNQGRCPSRLLVRFVRKIRKVGRAYVFLFASSPPSASG